MASESIYVPPSGGGMAIGGTITSASVTNGILTENGGVLAENSAFYIITSGTQGMHMGNATIIGPAATQTYTLPAQSGTYAMVTNNTDMTINGLTVGQGLVNGQQNTAIGFAAMASVTTAQASVAVGYQALTAMTTAQASSNTGVGYQAGAGLTTGQKNSIFGNQAMNTCGGAASNNTAIGRSALKSATGNDNTGCGYSVFSGLSFSGAQNVGFGEAAGVGLTSGTYNTLIGHACAGNLTTGWSNIVVSTLSGGPVGGSALTTESNSVLVGGYIGTTGVDGQVTISDGLGNVMWSNQVRQLNYGTTTNLDATDGTYDIEIGNSGSGATVVNLPTGTNAPVGKVYEIWDLGANAVVNNITLDAGAVNSNKIVGTTVSQTYVISISGGGAKIKKVSATKWKVQ